MPYFRWVGVDITGTIKKGKKSASSPEDLSQQLLNHGLAVLSYKIVHAPSFLWPISAKTKSDLFKQKGKLLRAGVLLPNVLHVVAQQLGNPIMYDVLLQVNHDVQHGISFDKAVEKHQELCDPIVVIMLAAGHESGNIIHAVENVVHYFDKQHIFNKNLRAALAMPFLTLSFFIGISFFIFIFIIPRFADMFISLQQELTALTRFMLSVSAFMSSYLMLYLIVFVAITLICIQRYFMTKQGRKKWNMLMNNIPFISTIVWQYHMCQALQALALLVSSGAPLMTGLKIISDSVEHQKIKAQLKVIYHDVEAGKLLASAMAETMLFLPEVIALVYVGQESGTLGNSLEAAALVYNDKVEESLRRFVFFLQPCVIILLGLLVTILIFAVYSPIMQLSHVV